MSTFERAAAGGDCDLYGWWVRDPYRGLPRAWIAYGCDVRDHPEGRCPKALGVTEADRLRAQFVRPLTWFRGDCGHEWNLRFPTEACPYCAGAAERLATIDLAPPPSHAVDALLYGFAGLAPHDARLKVPVPLDDHPLRQVVRERDEARAAAEDYRQQAASALEIIDGLHAALAALEVAFVGPKLDPAHAEEGACRLIWWPNEWPIPYIDGETGKRTLAPWSAPRITGADEARDAELAALKAENMRLTDLLGQRASAAGEPEEPDPFPSRALRTHAQQTGVGTPNLR